MKGRKKMKKIFKKIMALILTVITVSTSTSMAVFAGENVEPQAVLKDSNTIRFSGLSELDLNESIEYEIVDKNGQPATVGIERVSNLARASWQEWKVWYTSGVISAHFYMKVTDNKVTSVYDDWILVVGGTYDSDSLTKTSTYGKLSFKTTAYAGLFSIKCWLKGTVTGSNNDIDVSWSM